MHMFTPLGRPVLFILNSSFPEYSGGRENWLYQVASRLHARGHDIRLLTLAKGDGQLTHYKLNGGIRLYRVSVWTQTVLGKLATLGPLRVLRTFTVVIPFRWFLRRHACHWHPRPIVVGLDTLVAPLAMRGMENKMDFVCASKGPHAEVMAQHFPRLSKWFYKLEIQAYRSCRELWSNGYDMRDYILRQGFDSVVIGNGVDTADAIAPRDLPSEYDVDHRTFRVVSVGSVMDIKGVSNAIHALSLVADINLRARIELFFVGKGDPRRYIAQCKALGLSSQVHFLGARQDVFSYMQHADLLLCLSGGGGMSMAALESLATGVTVLAWDTPVYQQLITHGENGFLVQYQDDEALAQELTLVAGLSLEERCLVGKRACASVQVFEWERVVDNIETRLRNLCE